MKKASNAKAWQTKSGFSWEVLEQVLGFADLREERLTDVAMSSPSACCEFDQVLVDLHHKTDNCRNFDSCEASVAFVAVTSETQVEAR